MTRRLSMQTFVLMFLCLLSGIAIGMPIGVIMGEPKQPKRDEKGRFQK